MCCCIRGPQNVRSTRLSTCLTPRRGSDRKNPQQRTFPCELSASCAVASPGVGGQASLRVLLGIARYLPGPVTRAFNNLQWTPSVCFHLLLPPPSIPPTPPTRTASKTIKSAFWHGDDVSRRHRCRSVRAAVQGLRAEENVFREARRTKVLSCASAVLLLYRGSSVLSAKRIYMPEYNTTVKIVVMDGNVLGSVLSVSVFYFVLWGERHEARQLNGISALTKKSPTG